MRAMLIKGVVYTLIALVVTVGASLWYGPQAADPQALASALSGYWAAKGKPGTIQVVGLDAKPAQTFRLLPGSTVEGHARVVVTEGSAAHEQELAFAWRWRSNCERVGRKQRCSHAPEIASLEGVP